MGNGGVLGARWCMVMNDGEWWCLGYKVVYVVVGGVLPLTLTPSTLVGASSRTYCPKKDVPLAIIV
jgi:hypothetical protein